MTRRRRIGLATVVAVCVTVAAIVATRGVSSAGSVDRITDAQGAQGCPKWSPDGRLILYATGFPGPRRVEITDVATGASRAIALGSDPGVVPDGRTVVFVHRHTLVLVGARGGHERRLVAMRGAVHAPAWSPDSTTVAYFCDRPGPFVVVATVGRSPPVAAGSPAAKLPAGRGARSSASLGTAIGKPALGRQHATSPAMRIRS